MKSTLNFTKRPGHIAFLASAALLGLMSWMAPTSYQPIQENDLIRFIKNRSKDALDQRPEDRVYLHTDKSLYQPGESIWFSAYVRNGHNMKASEQSDIVHVELINPKGSIEKAYRLIAKNGKAVGDISLDEEVPGGLYKIKAYTQWQKNDSSYFEKELTVQSVVLPALKMKLDFERKAFGAGDEVSAKLQVETNENKPLSSFKIRYVAMLNGEKLTEQSALTDAIGNKIIRFTLPAKLKSVDGLLNIMIDYQGQTESISRSIPIILNNIQLSFFPEGGDLVRGIESKVAFRAINEFGKPADVRGIIKNSKGKQVASFNSFHQGMGAFDLNPSIGEKYHAVIIEPSGITSEYPLPPALNRGYVLSVAPSGADALSAQIHSTEQEELSLVAQVRGRVCYATNIQAVPGQNAVMIPTNVFPAGVAQFTLFDNKGVERAERLMFVNKNQQLEISIDTDKDKYLPREKVNMVVSVRDERGLPVPANLSLSVVNDQLLAFADDKQSNILTQMLLESDIREKITEPNFYFKPGEAKADQALDYLLLTSGWRRFTWEQVLNNDLPSVRFQGEKALLGGIIVDAYTGQPIPGAKVRVNADGEMTATDSNGRFTIKKADLSESVQLQLTASGYQQQHQPVEDYNPNLYFYLYPTNYHYRTESGSIKRKSAANARFMAPAAGAVAEEALAMDMDIPMAAEAERAQPLKAEPSRNLNKASADKKDSEKKNAEVKSANLQVDDQRAKRMSRHDSMNDKEGVRGLRAAGYYRARQFPAPVYKQGEVPEQRTDFRSTVYWNPRVETGRNGRAEVSFYNNDEITSFRVIAEGIGSDGSIGRSEKTFFTQLPFALMTKLPTEVVTEDQVAVPITLKNNTNQPVTGLLKCILPKSLESTTAIPEVQTIAPGKAKTIFLSFRVKNELSTENMVVSYTACGMKDAVSQKLNVVSKGFPVQASYSGDKAESTYEVEIRHSVKGSIRAKVTAFPSVVGDLLTGVEGILREPGGCFEQTSMSSYPNAMVMDYLKTSETKDDKLLAHAGGLLDRGYKRLVTFETSEEGYEWFGKAPGHQGLTAYGLMQFNDLKKVYEGVDDKMVNRTAEWILAQRDGKGGFNRNTYALHDFGSISNDVMNGYIVYAMAEAGYGKELKKEAARSFETSMKNKDPYQLAMSANALYRMNEASAEKALAELLQTQEKDGSFNGTTHSITHSTGQSLKIETTSLAILAMLKAPNRPVQSINKAVDFLIKSRSGYGTFGNTQGTVLALKAMTEYAKANKSTPEDGQLEVYVDGKKVSERRYVAGEKEAIVLDGLEQHLKDGKNKLQVRFVNTKNPLPHSVSVTWNTSLPESQSECKLDVRTSYSAKSVMQGETVRLGIELKNKTSEGLPSPIAIIGIPAGLSLQPWQLKELQEKNAFDYYEVIGNNLVLYYRGMAPSEVKQINLDLKADIPGQFEAPASSAYLYYTNEYKSWEAGGKILVKQPI